MFFFSSKEWKDRYVERIKSRRSFPLLFPTEKIPSNIRKGGRLDLSLSSDEVNDDDVWSSSCDGVVVVDSSAASSLATDSLTLCQRLICMTIITAKTKPRKIQLPKLRLYLAIGDIFSFCITLCSLKQRQVGSNCLCSPPPPPPTHTQFMLWP